MNPQPYPSISDLYLLALCVWRESRGEPQEAQRGVAWTVANRVKHPGWWGHDWKTVILKPWQFSSFNAGDSNSIYWPNDDDLSWHSCLEMASEAYTNVGDDPTGGAQFYHDTSMGWPKAWGSQDDYINTLNVGRLKFYKQNWKGNTHDEVQDAVSGL